MSTGSSQFQIPGSATFVRLMQVLTRYMSAGVAMSLVNKSLVELGMTPETMTNVDLPEVIQQTMAGLRAFCPEKQLNDLHTFVQKLSVLDPAESWHPDPTQDCWASDPAETSKTKKVPRNHVKAEATEKHPAQVEVYHEDIVVGYWKTVKFSGAVPAARVRELTERVEKLQRAVKMAREEANSAPAEKVQTGDRVFGYLFGT